MGNTTTSAWWADQGPDTCAYCETSYYAETGYYCELCDGAICSVCVITDSRSSQVICPQCYEDEQSKGVK